MIDYCRMCVCACVCAAPRKQLRLPGHSVQHRAQLPSYDITACRVNSLMYSILSDVRLELQLIIHIHKYTTVCVCVFMLCLFLLWLCWCVREGGVNGFVRRCLLFGESETEPEKERKREKQTERFHYRFVFLDVYCSQPPPPSQCLRLLSSAGSPVIRWAPQPCLLAAN